MKLPQIGAEGETSRTGKTLPFRKGMERIMKGVDAPIIPIHLGDVWGSVFSFERGRLYWKIPRRIPYSVRVSFGTSMPPCSPPREIRESVIALGGEALAS